MHLNSVFISHSSKEPDYDVTRSLSEGLVKSGFDVWWDEKRLEYGNDFTAEILEAIRIQKIFIYIISPRSVTSQWCARELTRAVQLGKDVFPMLLEDVPIEKQPLELSGLQYIPINQGIPEAMPKILSALGIGKPSELQLSEDPFALDGRLVRAIANQIAYAETFTDSLNCIHMLRAIGENCCETDRARILFSEMESHSHYSG